MGLNAAFLLGLITSIFGGKPGMVSGATGALAVVQYYVVIKYDQEVLLFTMILCGIIQIILSLLNIGKLIKLVSEPVMIGFLNGLGIVICLAQFTS